MSSEKEHSQVVLAGILPDRKDRLDLALLKLTPDHFEPPYRLIFTMVEKYFQVTKGILTRQGANDILVRSGVTDIGVIATYLEYFDALVDQDVAEEDFTWSVDELQELLAKSATEKIILEGFEILKTGKNDAKTGERKGHSAAREAIIAGFAAVDQQFTISEAPEGDIRSEKDEILTRYHEKKEKAAKGENVGILTGIPCLDSVVGGFKPGELDLVVGYSSSGKSSLCVQVAWHGAIVQGKNMVFATTETLRDQIVSRIIARHSKLPMFEYPAGLDNKSIYEGTLTSEEEVVFEAVLEDLAYNSSYGRLEIAQVPRKSSIFTLENRLSRYNNEFRVDGCVMDYLALLTATRKRGTSHEEHSDTMKESKSIAATFDDGRGIPIISPWQTTRAQKELADKLGYYTTLATAETREATNSADVIATLLEPAQLTRYTKLSGAIIKNRNGPQVGSLGIDVDYATSCFTDASINIVSQSSSNGSGNFFDLL